MLMGDATRHPVWQPREPLLLVLLLLLGFVGNYFSFPLFFGVDFLFGGISSLIILSLYGPVWGVVSAIAISSYTYPLWGHPYAIVIFTLELATVGICLQKSRRSLLQCDGAFWLFLGIPAVFLFYFLIMKMDLISTTVIMLKQCTNGIFNALIASLLINLLPALRMRRIIGKARTIPLREILFNFMIALVLFPVLGIMIVEGRTAMSRMEQGVAANLKTLSADASRHLEAWFNERLHAVEELATMAGQVPLADKETLQSSTEIVKRMFPDFHNMYVADHGGTTVAFYPPVNEKGESTIGLNFSDRDYYKRLKAERHPVLSEVLLGRGGIFSPIVTLSAPMIVADQFKGFALAAIDLTQLRYLIDQYSQQGRYQITLCDQDQHVITSTVSGREAMQYFDHRQTGNLKSYGSSFFLWSPAAQNLPAMTRFKKSLYVNEELISDHLPWKIIVEYPVARQQVVLYSLYNRYLSTLLIFTAVTFLLTAVISPWLARPLTHLAAWTERMPDPERLIDTEEETLPESAVTEIDSLMSNFAVMKSALKSNFRELEKRSEETECVNVELKTKIRELETARKAVLESEGKALSMLNSITETLMLVDEEGTVLAANPSAAKRLEKPVEKIIGTRLSDLFPDAAISQDISEVFATGTPLRREIEVQERISDTHYYPGFDSRGKVFQVAVFVLDITDKRRLESRLQRAEKMEALGTLAGGVAHDLNNILSGIVSYPDLLLLDLPKDSTLTKPIETIKKSGEKAAAIVQDLLTLSRRGAVVTEVVDLNEIVSEQLKSPEFKLLRSHHPLVRIESDLAINLLPIKGSSIHLSKMVMNLFSNAAEAMPDGGLLQVSTKNRYIDRPVEGYDEVQEGDYVVLTVSDRGVGIRPEDMRRIFEPFYSKKVMGRSGTGLGMAVVWGAVKDHHGYIDLQSTTGKGATISVYLPATRLELPVVPDGRTLEDLMGRGESILVVDDVAEQREIASRLLNRLGYAVTTASSGEEAVVKVKRNTPDLVLLDMIMAPGMDGLSTYEEILAFAPDQKAIIVSGFSETDRVRRALELGAGKYVKKPYSIETIGRAVKAILTS